MRKKSRRLDRRLVCSSLQSKHWSTRCPAASQHRHNPHPNSSIVAGSGTTMIMPRISPPLNCVVWKVHVGVNRSARCVQLCGERRAVALRRIPTTSNRAADAGGKRRDNMIIGIVVVERADQRIPTRRLPFVVGVTVARRMDVRDRQVVVGVWRLGRLEWPRYRNRYYSRCEVNVICSGTSSAGSAVFWSLIVRCIDRRTERCRARSAGGQRRYNSSAVVPRRWLGPLSAECFESTASSGANYQARSSTEKARSTNGGRSIGGLLRDEKC